MQLFKFLNPVQTPHKPSTYKFSLRAKLITLWLIAGLIILFLFRFFHVLPVFIWAAIAAYLFSPLVSFLTDKTKIPKFIWIIILYIVLGFLIFVFVKSFYPLVSNEISDLVSGSMDEPTTFLGKIASQGNISILGIDINLREQVQLFSGWVKTQFPLQAWPLFFGAVERFIFLLVFFVVTFYFILESGNYVERLKAIIPHPYKQEISNLLEKINLTLGAYLRAQVILIIIMSFASFIILSILKIKYAIVLSLMTGFLEIIPIAGPICATTVVTTVALFQTGAPFGISNASLAIIVIAAYFALRQLEDYFVIPNVVSRFVKVHPVVAIFALVVGGTVGGVLGLFLAIPTAAILKVFSEYIYLKLLEE